MLEARASAEMAAPPSHRNGRSDGACIQSLEVHAPHFDTSSFSPRSVPRLGWATDGVALYLLTQHRRLFWGPAPPYFELWQFRGEEEKNTPAVLECAELSLSWACWQRSRLFAVRCFNKAPPQTQTRPQLCQPERRYEHHGICLGLLDTLVAEARDQFSGEDHWRHSRIQVCAPWPGASAIGAFCSTGHGHSITDSMNRAAGFHARPPPETKRRSLRTDKPAFKNSRA